MTESPVTTPLSLAESSCQDVAANPELNIKQSLVRPNPFRDYVTVDAAADIVKLEIRSMSGELKKTFKTAAGQKYDIAALPAGMYIAMLYRSDGTAIREVIVKE